MKESLASIALLVMLAGCAASAEDKARLDAQDDATCQARGLAADSDDYGRCKSELQSSRAAQQRPLPPYRRDGYGGVGGFGGFGYGPVW